MHRAPLSFSDPEVELLCLMSQNLSGCKWTYLSSPVVSFSLLSSPPVVDGRWLFRGKNRDEANWLIFDLNSNIDSLRRHMIGSEDTAGRTQTSDLNRNWRGHSRSDLLLMTGRSFHQLRGQRSGSHRGVLIVFRSEHELYWHTVVKVTNYSYFFTTVNLL